MGLLRSPTWLVHTKLLLYHLQSSLILDKGEVFGWGNNEYKQVTESEDVQQVCSPIHITNTKGLGKIIDITAGGSICAALNGKNKVVFIILILSAKS